MNDDTPNDHDAVDPLPELLPSEPAPAPPRKLGRPLVAWVVIVLMTVIAALAQALRKELPGAAQQESEVNLVLLQMRARSLVGAANTFGQSNATVYEQARELNTGPVEQRLRFITLAGELAGPAEALRQLADLDRKAAQQGVRMTPDQQRVEGILRRLYHDYEWLRPDAPSVSAADRKYLESRLGWFGELALAPAVLPPLWRQTVLATSGAAMFAAPVLPALAAVAFQSAAPDRTPQRERIVEPARQTFLTMVGAAVLALFVGVGGFIGLIVLIVLYCLGKLRGGLACGSRHGGLYAETFALWLLLFGGLNLVVPNLPEAVPRLPALVVADLLSLLVLAWPVVRGVPWRQVRQDIGWTAGREPALEPLAGIGCYAMSLPLLIVGAAVMLLLLALQHSLASGGAPGDSFAPGGEPTHPIILAVARGDWWERLLVFVLAAVLAPLVEETMFRGVLYRHLREATCAARAFWSALFSATVVSFLFAVVHPQGLIAVPALMALAYAFTLGREWRGSLVAPMVAHGINNGLLMLMLMLALGD